jgi:hypothetical protein
MYSCPVCGFPGLRYPPRQFSTCPSCVTEFENDDFGTTVQEVQENWLRLRNAWVAAGARWRSRIVRQPQGWSGLIQLREAGLTFQLPAGMLPPPPRAVADVQLGTPEVGAPPARPRRAFATEVSSGQVLYVGVAQVQVA